MEIIVQKPKSLNTEVKELAKQLYHLNQLTPYTITDIQIEDMAYSIYELVPELKPYQLKRMIDRFKIGIYDWDRAYLLPNIMKKAYQIISEEVNDSEQLKQLKDRLTKPTIQPR